MKASENPFRSSAVAELGYRAPAGRVEALLRRWQGSQEPLLAILGPEGSGKTALLEAIADRADPTPHWLRVDADSSAGDIRETLRQLAATPARAACCLDGAEVLGPWDWLHIRRIARRRQIRLLVTLQKPRRIPIFATLAPDRALALDLVDRLAPEITAELKPIAEKAFEASNGNLREVLRACYWACARRALS